jgi:outer membrane protein assembly factor BamA
VIWPRFSVSCFGALLAPVVLSWLAPVALAEPILAIDIEGSIDPAGRVEAYVAELAPPGSPFVEEGEADREGLPISTPGRLRQALANLGYHATIEPRPNSSGGMRLSIRLRAHDRVRYIFVEGNRFLRQDEILRRVSLRPGHALPPLGPDRDRLIALEETRVHEYLRAEGYFDATVRLVLRGTEHVPSTVNVTVQISLGPPYTIGRIAINGNTALALTQGAIENELRHKDWHWAWMRPLPFRQSQLRDDLATLVRRYRDLGYAGVRIDRSLSVDRSGKLVHLQLQIRQRQHVAIAFEGNRRLDADDLLAALTLFERGSADDYEVDESVAELAHHYHERGHMLVRITWRRERLSPTQDRLVFLIDEGPVLPVREVRFVNNNHVPAGLLKQVVNVKVFPRFGVIGLGEGGYASPRQLAVDVDNLRAYYREAGFPEAEVSCEMAPAPSRWQPCGPIPAQDRGPWTGATALHVRFLITEGVEVRIRKIGFRAFPQTEPAVLPRDEKFLRALLLSRLGERLESYLVRHDAERLRRVLGDEGYLGARVELEVSRAGGDAQILWQLALGPRVRVGPVFVRGNFLTRERTILQWVPLDPGMLLTTTAIERGQRNLALIQLFGNSSPMRFPRLQPDDAVVPMLVEVEERHDLWGRLRFGGGASTEQIVPGSDFPFGVFASAGYEHRNFLGHGWSLLSSGHHGTSVTRTDAAFVNPRLFSTLFRLELAGNYLRQATVSLGDIQSGGGSLGWAREMAPGVDARLRYNLRKTLRTEFFLRAAGANEEQTSVRLGTTVGSLSLSVDWLRVDHPLAPTRGFKVSGGVEMALPALSFKNGEDTFLKLIGRVLAVVPLTRRLSLQHSVRYDQGLPFGSPVLPKVERYFAGGATTIRGFELDRARIEVRCAPIVVGFDVGPARGNCSGGAAPGVYAVEYQPVGGSLRILHNIDLHFALAPPLYVGVFLDSGLVADSLLDFEPTRFRHGIGFSPLLVKLPIGDISLSWAWPIDSGPGDTRIGRLHFNVGLMF